ncbi:MAG TPA: pyrroloquinoline quinone biosynthesis protein PqqE [Polyangiaceae bacterium]|nr:pyrroloquinoline quinone biosynthesis protein PqqE [Polyangiaceae bacterium]
MATPSPSASASAGELRPYTLVAELTYRCPLACVYCSNPSDFDRHRPELGTSEWLDVFASAEALGVVQLNLSGGEPLLRKDLEQLVAGAHRLQLYTNLITSGLPLERSRLADLRAAGLANVQLSIQDATAEGSERISGKISFEHKLEVARWVKELRLPLTLNFVLHRENLGRVGDMIALAESLDADRLELANTQYLGWALHNRAALLPSAEQLKAAREVAAAARRRLKGKMEVLFVTPDYYSELPRPCMDGWGRRFLLVSPTGLVLPCHLAHTLPGLEWWSVKDAPLDEIWQHSPGLEAFRGEAWMGEPCRSCERRGVDFGGCRCQAYHLTGNAAHTDPACALSPHHELIVLARRSRSEPDAPVPLRYRRKGSAPKP